MNLKVWFFAVLLLAACFGSSLQEDQKDSEVRRNSCPKGKHSKCFFVRYRNRRRLICRCVRRYYGDETAKPEDPVGGCHRYDPGGRCISYEF